MNCLPCLRKKSEEKKSDEKKSEEKKSDGKKSDKKEAEKLPVAQPKEVPLSKQSSVKIADSNKNKQDGNSKDIGGGDYVAVTVTDTNTTTATVTTTSAKDEPPKGSSGTFKLKELASATKNFKQECLLGESGFGKVYKGILADGKVVAVKQLAGLGTKGNEEFIEEAARLSDLNHPNLVELIGYCAHGDQRLLVYEYMPKGSIRDHLHDLSQGKTPLDWTRRMQAAAGAAQALEYLHYKVNPPVLCRNIRSTNVLLDENFEPKVTDYGLFNLESSSGSNMQQMVVGTVECAPEYESTGKLTLKFDVYSFGVILLELITGRKALDTSRPKNEQNLVSWAQSYFKDPKRYQELADPIFEGVISKKLINQAVGVAAMCLQQDSDVRPPISDIVGALILLTKPQPEEFIPQSAPEFTPQSAQPPTTTPQSAPEFTPQSAPTTTAPPKKYPSSSSTSSSSDSESDQELDIKIEPFNQPEKESEPESKPKPKPEPEPEREQGREYEWQQKPDWESNKESDSDNDTEPEPEPEPKPALEKEPESKPKPKPEPEREREYEWQQQPNWQSDQESDSDSDSDSNTDQEPEPEPEPEPDPEPEPVPDLTDSDSSSSSSSDSDREPVYIPEPVIEQEASPSYKDEPDSDSSSSSSSDSNDDEAKMQAKGSKERVTFNTEETESTKPSTNRVDSSYRKKSVKKSKDDDQSTRNSDSSGDDQFTDGSDDEFEPRRFSSTISRFEEARSNSIYLDDVYELSSDGEE